MLRHAWLAALLVGCAGEAQPDRVGEAKGKAGASVESDAKGAKVDADAKAKPGEPTPPDTAAPPEPEPAPDGPGPTDTAPPSEPTPDDEPTPRDTAPPTEDDPNPDAPEPTPTPTPAGPKWTLTCTERKGPSLTLSFVESGSVLSARLTHADGPPVDYGHPEALVLFVDLEEHVFVVDVIPPTEDDAEGLQLVAVPKTMRVTETDAKLRAKVSAYNWGGTGGTQEFEAACTATKEATP